MQATAIVNQRQETAIRVAIAHLRDARDQLVFAQAPNAANRVRKALKSAEGALRNAQVHANSPPDRIRRRASR